MDLPMGQFIMLREANMNKVAEITGWELEELQILLDRAKAKGKDRVKMPLVPRSALDSGVVDRMKHGV